MNDFKHGFDPELWEAAKEQGRQILIECARSRIDPRISYSEFASRLTHIKLEPSDPRLFHLLGQISTEEDANGRGMLSALVVHKDGDQRPGTGFYELAKALGRDIRDRDLMWSNEFKKVIASWKGRK